MARRKGTSQDALVGRLEAFTEPGDSVTFWAFREQNRFGEDGALHPLRKGDLLTVFNDASRTDEAWHGEIDLDFKACREQNPRATHITAQRVSGHGTVHGVQKDVNPKDWGDMFSAEKPALLTPRDKRLNF